MLKMLVNSCDSDELAQTIIGIFYSEKNAQDNELLLKFMDQLLKESWDSSKQDTTKELFLRRGNNLFNKSIFLTFSKY